MDDFRAAEQLDAIWSNAERLAEALELCLKAFARHDRWCGYNTEAPGDMVLNVARDKARLVLAGHRREEERR